MIRTPSTPRGHVAGSLLGAASLTAIAVGPASAHGTTLEEFQAPLPLPYLLAGAAATVVLTAVLLVAAGAVPDGRRTVATVGDRASRWLPAVARVGFLLLVAAAVAHGLVGQQVAADNLATVVVWPLWLKGVAILAIAAGSPWRVLSPWRTIYEWLCRLEGADLGPYTLPARLGVWPALLGVVLLVGLVENLTAIPRSPAATAAVVASYAAVMLAGGLAFGREWFRRADPLEVLYRLLGRTAPLEVSLTGTDRAPSSRRLQVAIRAPWRGTSEAVAHRTAVAVVVAAVYTVSFDGFVETGTFQALQFAVREATGLGAATPAALYVAGLLAFLALFWLVAGLTGRLGGFDAPALALAATVVPIAAAYEVAHTYLFVLANLGRLPATLGGPGLDLIGWLSVPAFWGSQVLLIVVGHVVAVIAAHLVVVRRVEAARRTAIGHAPLVVLMVCYTVLSLWIVSRPVVG